MANIEINLTPTATLLEIGNKISCRSWGIASESSAAFLLVHGLGGHSGWFEAFARRLKIKHIFGLALDLRGFGKRKNEIGVSVNNWIEDLEIAAKYLHSLMGNKPVFLLGNSMGALIALKACQRVKPSGLALLSPAFAGHPKIFPLSYQINELVKAVIKPSSQVILPYGTELITKEEQLKIWLDNDEDRRRAVPSKVLLDLFFLTQSLRLKKINLDCPLFLITAGMDGIVDNKASEVVFRQINSPHKKKTNLPNAMHDLTLDLAVEQVANLLIDWSNSIIQTQDKEKENLVTKQRAR